MEQNVKEPEFKNYSELKKIEEGNILSKVKEITSTFGNGISMVLMQDTCQFVQVELQEVLDELHELNDTAVMRINNGVFTRTFAAQLLLDLVESSKIIDLYESKINANLINCESCKN